MALLLLPVSLWGTRESFSESLPDEVVVVGGACIVVFMNNTETLHINSRDTYEGDPEVLLIENPGWIARQAQVCTVSIKVEGLAQAGTQAKAAKLAGQIRRMGIQNGTKVRITMLPGSYQGTKMQVRAWA